MESQKKKMYEFMSHFPDCPFLVSDFMKSDCFIGYKAWTRMNELVHEWKVKVVGKEWRFALYQAIPESQQKPVDHNRFLWFIKRFFA